MASIPQPGRSCCLPCLLPLDLCPNPLPAGATGDRSQLDHGLPAKPAGRPGPPAGTGGQAGRAGRLGSYWTAPDHKMRFGSPFCGIWDAILDQIRRTRLKKLNIHDFGSKKDEFHGIRDDILDQIRRTLFKKLQQDDVKTAFSIVVNLVPVFTQKQKQKLTKNCICQSKKQKRQKQKLISLEQKQESKSKN